MSCELHPLVRLHLERLEKAGAKERALRERRRRALERPEARAEWELADQLSPDLKLATVEEWADALVDVAPPQRRRRHRRGCALRDSLLEAATPERANAFAGLLKLSDDVIVRAGEALHEQREDD
jgi:hypothetical protein